MHYFLKFKAKKFIALFIFPTKASSFVFFVCGAIAAIIEAIAIVHTIIFIIVQIMLKHLS